MEERVYVSNIASHEGQTVTLRGWLYNKRSSGKLHFLQVRDGTGTIQCVVFKGDVTPEVQRELVGLGFDLSCDVLKVPHHGAPRGVAPTFAEACGATYGVVSVGTRFASHPSPETVLPSSHSSPAVTLSVASLSVESATDTVRATESVPSVGVEDSGSV